MDIIEFTEDVLGIKGLTDFQKYMLKEFSKKEKTVIVMPSRINGKQLIMNIINEYNKLGNK